MGRSKSSRSFDWDPRSPEPDRSVADADFMRPSAMGLSASLVALALLVSRPGLADVPPPSAGAPQADPAAPAANGHAEPRGRLQWDPRWYTFRPIEYVATGATGAAAIFVFLDVKASD